MRKIGKLEDKSGGRTNGNLGNAHIDNTAVKRCELYPTDKSEEGKACSILGYAYHSLGDFKTAIDYHERHLKIAQELGDRSGEGQAYFNVGNAHHSLGNFKTATDFYKLCIKIAKELNDESLAGKAYCNLGNAHHSLGDFKNSHRLP